MRRVLWIGPTLILVVTAGVFAIWWLQFNAAKEAVFQSLMRNLSRQIEAEFARIFDPVITNLLIARKWGEEGLLSSKSPRDLNASFMAILQQVPQISSILIADGDGREYMLLRDEDQWQTRRTDVQKWGGRTLWNRWAQPSEPLEEWWRDIDYDPRERPWFQGAVAADDDSSPHWTEPYAFLTTRQPGITASIRWRNPETPEADHVVAFDVLLSDIAARIEGLSVGDNGKAFVMTDTGHLIGISRDQTPANRRLPVGAALPTIEDLAVAGVTDAVAAWKETDRGFDDPYSYRSAGANWWAGFWPLRLAERTLWLGIVMPEAELLAQVGGVSGVVPVTIVSIGVVAAFGLFVVLLRKSRVTDAVGMPSQGPGFMDETTTPENLLTLIGQGESDRLEFKSTVRHNLHTGKPGKEIELAWLKVVVSYLNTEGGTVLIGVDDAGTIRGLDRDGYTNDDKCLRHIDNLITDHIGTEHAPFVSLRIVSVNESKVAVIRVRRSPQPAFLRVGKDEDFYVRSGPTSRKLPPSRIQAYLQARTDG